MKMIGNHYKIISAVSVILSIVAIVAVAVTGGCGGSLETTAGLVPMKCHYTMKIVIILSSCMLVMCILSYIAKTKETKIVCMIGVMLFAFAVFITTTGAGIGVCTSAGMSCRRMAVIVKCDTVIIMMVSVLGIIYSGDRHKKQKRGF